ncbi:MAG: hypothetical protein J6I64_03225 [Lachnospiraceae bacterium]|nr:hypothetical protein [Lachnospiraceae bacterium]
MEQKKGKKILLGIVVGVFLVGLLLFAAYQIPGVHFMGKIVHINLQEEWYRYDPEEGLTGTIPVRIKGVIDGERGEFYGTIVVEGHKIEYLDDPSNDHVYYDEETDIVHVVMKGIKSIVENHIPDFLYSEYSYTMSIREETPEQVIIRVGQLEKIPSQSGGWHIQYPEIFSAIRAEEEGSVEELYHFWH